MKKLLLIFICITSLSSCSDHQTMKWVCSCSEQEKVATFITSNVKSSNNMSDEEMEDVISELRETAIKVNCHQKLMWVDNQHIVNWEKTKLDSCEIFMNIY